MTVSDFEQKSLTKGYDGNESTSREDRTETDKSSVLPSFPENFTVTGSTILSKYSRRAPLGISQKGFWYANQRYVLLTTGDVNWSVISSLSLEMTNDT